MSIAEKLIQIAENEQKVYDTGYNSGYNSGHNSGYDAGYDEAEEITISIIERSITNLVIPNGVTSIGSYAFRDCTSLTSATIGNGVTSIGINAFYNCTSLISIEIPDSVTSINNQAFDNCTSLTSVTIGNGVMSIGSYAFRNCISLASITIPDSVTSIGHSTFYNCQSLASITIGNSVTLIKDFAFASCSNCLEYDFSNCTSVPSLQGTNVFDQINNDAKILVPAALYDEWISATNWTAYKEHIFITPSTGLLYEYNGTYSYYSVIGRGSCKDSTIVIPATYDDGVNGEHPVEYTGREAFQNDQTLEEIILPENAEQQFSISGDPFKGSSLKVIRNYCRGESFSLSGLNLEYVSILDGANIDNFNFYGIVGSPVYDFGRHTSVAELRDVSYISVGENTRIIVPAALLDEWKQATNWAVYAQYIVAAE